MITFLLGMYGAFIASFLFWPVMVLVLLILCWTSESDEFVWSAILTVGFITMLGNKIDVSSLFSSPLSITLTIIGYASAGVIWASMKWYLKARNSVRQFEAIRDEYTTDQNLPRDFFKNSVESNEQKEHHVKFADRIYRKMMTGKGLSKPATAQEALEGIKIRISNHKKSFCMWWAYWPVSLTWFALSDLVREIAETVYDTVSGTLQKMSDRMYKDVL